MDTKIASFAKHYSAQNLAYIGDAVFELHVRKMLLSTGNRSVNALNKAARGYVSAKAQAVMYHAVEPHLSEEEMSAMRRGRNIRTNTKAKNAGMSEYKHATGLEALFGYLFVNERHERIAEIFNICIGVHDE